MSRVRQFFAQHRKGAAILPQPSSLKSSGWVNQDSLVALGLAALSTEKTPQLLQLHKRRFWLPKTELPPKVQATSLDRTRRACILDENTEETKVECIWEPST